MIWNSGDRGRQFQGSVSIDRGKLDFVRAIGSQADEPGSMWLDDGKIAIRQRSPRREDGVEVQTTAPPESSLKIELHDVADPSAAVLTAEVSLADLAAKPVGKDLDKFGAHVLFRRAPGDMLRIDLKRDHLVFAPGETLQFEVQPRVLPVAVGTTVQLQARLLAKGSGKEFSSQEQSIKTTAEDSVPASVPWQIKLPTAEGVYDVVIQAIEPASLRWPRARLLVERHMQLVVMADQFSPAPDANAPWQTVMEIDPANPHWYDRFKTWSLIPNLSQGTLNNGPLQIVSHSTGAAVELLPNPMGVPVLASNGASNDAADLHWSAYPLTIARIGAPHILEIEYPSDLPQTLGISIVEPGSADSTVPVNLDSGFYVDGDEIGVGSATWQKHRLLFWPRTNKAILLITNRSGNSKAAYGKIRVLAGPSHLPRSFAVGDTPERMLAGYHDRPLLSANFGAALATDPISQRNIDDWQSVYEGATRAAEYFNYIGYSGEMLTVAADGGTIYPSQLLEPTPQYDSGCYSEMGNDPAQKDALELTLRVFDREALKLIPTLQFNGALPQLELRLRRGGDTAVGIELVGPDGKGRADRPPAQSAAGPYYNPLNEAVQDAMLAVVRELLQRYHQHPAFAGLAIDLSADCYTQFPGEMWGIDDDTIKRFERATGFQVPGSGEKRFIDRVTFFSEPQHGEAPKPQRDAWLKWRASVLADFYRRIQKEVATYRPDAVLYLAGSNLFQTADAERLLRPTLPSASRIDDALLAVGIRPELLRDQRGIVLLRPVQVLPPGPPVPQGVDLETNRSADIDAQFHGAASTGVLFTNEPQLARIGSFDAKSPFGKDKTSTRLTAELSPADRRNRQRFVHALAVSDPDVMFDGGPMLTMGQEDSLFDLVATYRRLPAGKFTTVADVPAPVAIRSLPTSNSTYVYLVNDSQWPVTLQTNVNLAPGTRMEELSGRRQLPPLSGNQWSVTLKPFDLVAVRFWSSSVAIEKPQVTFDPHIKPLLANRIQDFRERMATLVNPPTPLPLLANPNFEIPAKKGQIPGWSFAGGPGSNVSLDAEGAAPPGTLKPVGKQAARMESSGPITELMSEPFPAPKTGRLGVWVWLRIEDEKQQPSLAMAIRDVHGERSYFKYGQLGQQQPPIHVAWSQFILPFDDVPASGVDKLQLDFILQGSGRVWIDDVQLFDLGFSQTEISQLGKILALADAQLQNGEYGQCLSELESYWPRFLSAYVPIGAQTVATGPIAKPAAGTTAPPSPTDRSATKPNGPLNWVESILTK